MHIIGSSKVDLRSQKGAAIVLVAVLVTGIVMLVSVVAIERLRESAELSGIQKRSLDTLYKAEEGAEYGLFINKEKPINVATQDNDKRPFDISLWEKVGEEAPIIKKNERALEQLSQPTEGRNIVITSQSQGNANENQSATSQRTIFTNLPNKYYDQVSLWNIREGCPEDNENCVSYENNDMEDGRTYQIVVPSAIFERSGWEDPDLEYRLVFKCGEHEYWSGSIPENQTTAGCTVDNVYLKIGGCNTTACKIENCSYTIPIKFSNGQSSMEEKILPTEWFQIVDPSSNQEINLIGEKVVVEFELVNGFMEEATLGGDQEAIRMCKEKDDGTWQEFRDQQGGLSSMEVRKKSDYKGMPGSNYGCCGYEQVCDQWEQVCDQWEQIPVCDQYEQVCDQYEQVCTEYNTMGCCAWDSEGQCTYSCFQGQCCGGGDPDTGACAQYCTVSCLNSANGDCLHYVNGSNCISSHYANGNCTHYTNGSCTHTYNGNCNQWCKQ